MRKGQMLAESNVELSVETVEGQRWLLASCPRYRTLDPPLLNLMLLHFDESDLCAPGRVTDALSRKSTKCSRRFDLCRVPLVQDISDEDAKSAGREIICFCFELHNLEATADASDPVEPVEPMVRRPKPTRTHRVHAALRAA